MKDREARASLALQRARELKGGKVEIAVAPTLYETPRWLAERMVREADLHEGDIILEPSAGTGRIIEAIPEGFKVYAVELDQKIARGLEERFPNVRASCADFLEMSWIGFKVNVILMNPPFNDGQDIKHILHARTALAPKGRIVAICADGPRQRAALQPIAEGYESLPEGTFRAAGTNVRAAIVIIDNI